MKRLLMLSMAILLCISPVLLKRGWSEEAPAEPELKIETYTYSSESRRDPFLSLIEKMTLEKKKKKSQGVTPLENFDLSQMKLIAIVWEKEQGYALIGLPDNKYYSVKAGMPIGIHNGKVQNITENSVTVREFLPDYRGELKPEDTIFRLRKEEGE